MEYYITDFQTSKPDAVALEDSIMKKGTLTTAGSRILENFIAPFSATVVERLLDSGKDISGKTRMKEFGLFGLSEDSGDDFSGSLRAVKESKVPCCLCNDLFGYYRHEAAQNDLCYLHPTYGTVSRYGLIPLASSMDRIGVLCKDLSDGFSTLSTIAGHDPKDGAMYPDEKYLYQNTQKKLTVCIPSNVVEAADSNTQEAIRNFAANFTILQHTLDYFDVCKQTMYILSCAEISNNISRYDGIKFGYRSPNAASLEHLYTKTRTEAFDADTKLAALMGAMVLSDGYYHRYYEKAMKIRRLLKEAIRFDEYDIMVLPVSISENPYDNLSLYAISSLTGYPSVSFMYQGCGIQLIANAKNESALLTAWEGARK